MSHQGISAPRPDWLAQVSEVTLRPEHAEGRSETGAVLAALADELGAGEPFAAGEVMGLVIERNSNTLRAVMVSTGNAAADVASAAHRYGVEPVNVSLMSARVLLEQSYQGVATCSTVD